jgi:DNA-binding IclR family transcriptional regulator
VTDVIDPPGVGVPAKFDDLPLVSANEAAPTIQTVQRAAMILAAFTVSQPYLSLNEITRRLGASKATAHRYTKALRAANLLGYDQNTALYLLGPQILTLAAAARAALPILGIAEPYMAQLQLRVDETIVLSVWDGQSPIVIRSLDNTERMIGVSVRTGTRLNLTGSAQGRVFCAHLSTRERPALDETPALKDELEAIRRDGVSINVAAPNGVRSVAAPVFQAGEVTACLAIIGTTASVSADPQSFMARALCDTTVALSARLDENDADDV